MEAPDWVTLSLDTVAIGLPINGSLPATPNGTFWAENAVRFNGTELQFEDNVWNFSAPDANLSASTLQVGTPLEVTSTATPWGQLSVLYYQHWGPSYSVTNPFTLTLINTVGVASGRPVLDFNFSLSSPGLAVNGSYDQVTFRQSVPSTEAPQFTVNGTARNPYGLRDDAEFVFAGDGMGSNGDIAALNGTAHLRYLDDGNYVRVPAAYDYGDDSGGTSSGIAPYYLGGTEYPERGALAPLRPLEHLRLSAGAGRPRRLDPRARRTATQVRSPLGHEPDRRGCEPIGQLLLRSHRRDRQHDDRPASPRSGRCLRFRGVG